MPSLQVRDMPYELYQRLVASAKRSNRSIAQQTITLLGDALGRQADNIERRKAAAHRIAAARYLVPDTLPEPAALVREDRDR